MEMFSHNKRETELQVEENRWLKWNNSLLNQQVSAATSRTWKCEQEIEVWQSWKVTGNTSMLPEISIHLRVLLLALKSCRAWLPHTLLRTAIRFRRVTFFFLPCLCSSTVSLTRFIWLAECARSRDSGAWWTRAQWLTLQSVTPGADECHNRILYQADICCSNEELGAVSEFNGHLM